MPYLSLFLSALIAATLLPLGSELLIGTLATQGHSLLGLWLAATIGNTLGSVINWWLGLKLLHFKDRRWFPFSHQQLARAQTCFNRYGLGTLLFAWLPIVGDPLTLVAGTLKVRLLPFVLLVMLGKGCRYGVILAIAANL